jgi:spore coat protein CotH
MEPGTPGRALSPADVRKYGSEPLYDPAVLRTIFLQFEAADWEQELAAFKDTDVEVPATVVVDGTTYKDVGVHFRGASSFMMVPEGLKRSLNLTFDFVNAKQAVGGYRTLNLLNANSDPTFVRAVLYSEIARSYIPAPKVNFVRVVINGESWGIYLNAQQYNRDFLRDFFKTDKGARWKVPGSPGGRAGMEYLGDDATAYRRLYEIKTKDTAKSWADLIAMFKILNETPVDRLEAALAPHLDIDGALKFLALDVALVNTDGYWTRASDYSIYQDETGRFHVIPHDMNEALMVEGGGGRRGGGSGGPGGPGGSPQGAGPDVLVQRGGPGPAGAAGAPQGPPPGMPPFGRGRGFGPRAGTDLDPRVGLDDPAKPLRSKLLAVPALRTRYLGYVRDIAERWLDWQKLEPMLAAHQKLIAEEVKADTRKLYSSEAFATGLSGSETSLQSFVEQRRKFLLNVTDSTGKVK